MRRLFRLVAIGALAGCVDADTLATDPRPSPPAGNVVTTQPADWRGYWRTDRNLWIYDVTPEVGIHAARGIGTDFSRIRNDLGMRIVRIQVDWRQYEAARLAGCTPYGQNTGCYTEGLKNAVHWAVDEEVELLVSVYLWPTRLDAMSTTQRYNEFALWMEDLVGLYGSVRFWQLGNEQDAGYWSDPFYNPGGLNTCNSPDRTQYGREYAKMLKVVYPRIKATNPNTWVLTAGLTGNEGYQVYPGVEIDSVSGSYCGLKFPTRALTWSFLNGMYAEGGRQYFDILAFHAYGVTPWSQYAFRDKGHSILNAIAQNGDANRPIWITEFGAPAVELSDGGNLLAGWNKPNWRSNFDQQQRQWWEDAIGIHASQRFFPKIIGYTLIGDVGNNSGGRINNTDNSKDFKEPLDPDYADYGFTLLRLGDESPRPAYTWLASRKAANQAAKSIGHRTGPFRLFMNSDFWRVPAAHAFQYDGDSYVIQNVTVNTLHPASVPFIRPIDARARSWQSLSNTSGTWLPWVANGQVVGTTGQSRPLEAIQVYHSELPYDIGIHYSLLVQGIGWTHASNGGVAGTTGQGRATYQVMMSLSDPQNRGWRICYQPHVAGTGWLPEACDGQAAGLTSAHLEAIRIRIRRD